MFQIGHQTAKIKTKCFIVRPCDLRITGLQIVTQILSCIHQDIDLDLGEDTKVKWIHVQWIFRSLWQRPSAVECFRVTCAITVQESLSVLKSGSGQMQKWSDHFKNRTYQIPISDDMSPKLGYIVIQWFGLKPETSILVGPSWKKRLGPIPEGSFLVGPSQCIMG